MLIIFAFLSIYSALSMIIHIIIKNSNKKIFILSANFGDLKKK
jgi:hypothetical protein